MAVTKIQGNGTSLTGGNTSITGTLLSPSTGNTLIVAYTSSDSSGTVTGPSGYTNILTDSDSSNHSGVIGIWYKVASGSEGNPTVSQVSSSASLTMFVWEFSGLDSTSPYDVSASNQTSGSGVTSLSTGVTSVNATAAAAEIVVLSGAGNLGTFSGWTNSITAESLSNSDAKYGYKILNSTQANSSTASWATSQTASAGIAVFKTTGGGGTRQIQGISAATGIHTLQL